MWLRRVALVAVVALAGAAAAADGRFTWHAEVIRVDAGVATVRVPASPAALAALGARAAGERLALVWSAGGEEVVYAPAVADMAPVTYGRGVEAERGAADPASRSATVRLEAGAAGATALSAHAGRWVRLDAPLQRAAGSAVGEVVAASRPEPPKAQAASAVAAGIAGTWTISATRKSGVSVGADCTLREAAGALAGVCVTRREGTVEVSGTIEGTRVTFRYLTPVRGDDYVWTGDLDSSGTRLKGTVRVADEIVEFSAAK